MTPIDLASFQHVVFFTGAGMSAECGVPTYRGSGGIWSQYNYEAYACQRAFDADPVKVLDFHELRRSTVLACPPHAGHHHLARLQAAFAHVDVITQNIDGMFQRAGVRVAAELHGSLWRLRCARHGIRSDEERGAFLERRCADCDAWLQPDITWFEDNVDADVFARAGALVSHADLFVSVGTSGAVWPAAGFAQQARRAGARMIEINPEDNEASQLYDERVRAAASEAIPRLFPIPS
ncbi:NAD-dependent deacetylase [Panacagrimonas perspica]|uniref:protein acetyllysine N-acetyltransferase n=1 Tax=Panacagrimonas perspica TaxID=381431 RepID=A0A4S3K150_9GAMM|nr:Sir2 family NAD-dependent protein deacetylase [Panacagrimonas perspica]TDU30829.1 NAD-dependent deacetylase [Panacagrimonas perspica]THD01640.1 RNA polymerase subunit sigma [Panacagrimonas perspica]